MPDHDQRHAGPTEEPWDQRQQAEQVHRDEHDRVAPVNADRLRLLGKIQVIRRFGGVRSEVEFRQRWAERFGLDGRSVLMINGHGGLTDKKKSKSRGKQLS